MKSKSILHAGIAAALMLAADSAPAGSTVATASINIGQCDYHFLFDLSGSMRNQMPSSSPYAGITRFDAMIERATSLITDLAAVDKDGIEITGFNDDPNQQTYSNVTPENVAATVAKLKIEGGTMLAGPLQKALDLAATRWNEKHQFIGIFTDGQPTDRAAVAKTIVEFTKKMDRDDQCAISFIQVGDDQQATDYLSKLDDELVPQGAKFDIVDRTTLEEIRSLALQGWVDKTFND